MKAQYISMLVALAEHGSLRAAARKLGKSQPALSQALQQAEEELGVTIFARSSRGVQLTELGERIIRRARTIDAEIDRLDEEIAQLRGEQRGTIRVGLSPFAAVRIIPRALARFRTTHPLVEVRLTSGLFPAALKPLREGKTDILLGPAPPAAMARDIAVEHLIETPISIVTSETSPLRHAKSLAELRDAQWILIGTPGGPGDIFREDGLDRSLMPPGPMTTSESYFGTLALVESLGAVCAFPTLLIEDIRKTWRVVPIGIEDRIAPLRLSMMTRAGYPLTPAADVLANCIRRQVASIDLRPSAD